MGAVALASTTLGHDRGYPIVEATLYIYCDECGSFNIKTYIRLSKLPLIFSVLTGGVYIIHLNDQWLVCLIPLAFFSLFLPWKDYLIKYKCRKCGNTRISEYNALHYQSYDLSVVDVPDKLTQKRYIDESVLHFPSFL